MRISFYFLLAKLTLLVSSSPNDVKTRLKNGQNVDQDTYSFVVKIERSGEQVCTGLLIDQQWILTLKICIDKRSLVKYKVHLKDADTGKFISRKLKRSKELEEKNAIVILLELDIIIQTKVFQTNDFNGGSIDNKKETKCIAVGFTSNGKSLNKVNVDVKSPKKCSGQACKKDLRFDTVNGADVCQSDNGAPVFCKIESKWLFTGVSAVKKGCQKKDIFIVTLSHLSRSISKALKEEQGTCVNPDCVLAAAQLLKSIDTDIDPCDNFYKFACGKYIKMTPLPADEWLYTTLGDVDEDIRMIMKYGLEEPSKPGEIEAVTKAKGFYEACMNSEAIESQGNVPLHKLMEDFGGLPVLGSASGGKWNKNAYSFEDLIVTSFQVTDSVPILYVHLDDVLLVSQEKYRLNFDQPSLNLPRELYLQGKEHPALMALKTYYLELFQAFGANESAAAEFTENTLDLEIDLANISSDAQYESSVIKVVPVSSLQEFGATVNFSQIVEGIYQVGGHSLNAFDVVTIFSIGYFKNTVTVLKKHSNSVIANYIVTKVVMTQVNFLPQIYTDITERFLAASGQASNTASTRLEYCDNMLRDRMPDVITRIFAEEAFLENDRRYVLEMVEDIKKSFKKIIDATKWMSKFTKRASKEKVDKMGVEVGYPEEIYNDALLNSVHKQFYITPGSPLTTAVSMSKAEMVREAQLLRKPLDNLNDPWKNSPLTINAFYKTGTNTIVIHSGILQGNVYSHSSPKYMNYGAIGMIIGHEITHGFVGNGGKYDKEGKQRTWWLQRDVDKIERKTQCFIDMWSNFTIPGTGGMKNNGQLTLNEVLPDHEGARISYKAYRRIIEKQQNGKEEKRLPGLPYTPNQLFFINLDQPFCTNIRNDMKKFWIQNIAHPLSLIRFVGLMQNSEEFADTWNCPVGSNMNPADKCTLFQ